MSYERERDRRTVRREYSSSLMSSAKWRVLMQAVNGLGVHQIIIKLIDSDKEYTTRGFDLRTPYHYVDDFHGPMPILSIEWIEFPRMAVFPRPNSVPAEQIPQDLDAIRAGIADTGKQFRIEDTERGFRVLGHVR